MENWIHAVTDSIQRYWIKSLCLQDWAIKINLKCDSRDLKNDRAGQVIYTLENKSARIDIIDPAACKEARVRALDEEQILLHELLHLKFALIWPNEDTTDERFMHQLIDDLARTMVNARTEGGKINEA